jgi:nitrite reductase/ring-hydroxylating ferredoxin subunit/uncharacterized membrane protein
VPRTHATRARSRGEAALYAANVWERLVETIEHARALDPLSRAVQAGVSRAVPNGPIKDALTGTWLGHPAHPMFTDLPIGFWTSAFVLDLVGGRRARPLAEVFVGLGVVSAVPTVATGAADWSDTDGRDRRLGVAHALTNGSAIALYAGSWRARRRGRHWRGVTLGMLGATAATAGAYLGGHLFARRGVGVDRTAFDDDAGDWTPTVAEAVLSGAATRIELGRTPVMLLRRGSDVIALAATCPHRGAPLDRGTLGANSVTCPWHGSCFALDSGELLRGPSPSPLRRFETRVRSGIVELRSAHG